MKKLTYIIIYAISVSVFSQEKVSSIIDYNFIIKNPDNTIFTRPYLLYLNNDISKFIANGIAERIDNIDDISEMQSSGKKFERKNIDINSPRDYVYTDSEKGKVIFQEEVARKMYIVQDDITKIDWKLISEKKKIGDFSCQKAIGSFRGREYTVWFTTEIPTTHGPWKLRGLPGLILEVSEDRGKYSFRASKINLKPNIEDIKRELKEPVDQNFSTLDDYILAIKNKQKDFEAMILASLPRGTELKSECEQCPKAEDLNLEIFR